MVRLFEQKGQIILPYILWPKRQSRPGQIVLLPLTAHCFIICTLLKLCDGYFSVKYSESEPITSHVTQVKVSSLRLR